MGTNLAGVSYYSSELPFVDIMKSSTESSLSSGNWFSGTSSTWDDGRTLSLDGNGWVRSLAPGQYAKKILLRDFGGHFPAGQYTVRYKGEGTLDFQFSARVVSQQPGQMVIEVTPSSEGILVVLTSTNASNYVRDIEIIMPGGICEGDPFVHVTSGGDCGSRRYLSFADYHNSILFYPVFAERARNYSVLRFMDWMGTNGSRISNWSQRPVLASHTWAVSVPAEVMVALANRLNAHPWFNIPHLADDDYTRQLAQLVKGRLSPSLGAYVEWSNEVWNSMFESYNYAHSQGAARGIDNMQYHAWRSEAVARLFKEALGGPRVVGVLESQADNNWLETHGLD
jgi:hypothetical protein